MVACAFKPWRGSAVLAKEAAMRKDRLAHFRKKLEDKHRQLVEEVGRTVLYGKGPEDDSIKDLGDQATSAYNREFLFELGNGDRRLLKEVVSALQKLDGGAFGACERCGEPIAEKRLEALPFARYCIECQRAVEEEERMAAG
jgi:DnaK suppressor protein